MAYSAPPHKPGYPKQATGHRKSQPARPVYTYNADVAKQTRGKQVQPIVYDYDRMIAQENQQKNSIDVPTFTNNAQPAAPAADSTPPAGAQAQRKNASAHNRPRPVSENVFEIPLREPQRPHAELYDQQARKKTGPERQQRREKTTAKEKKKPGGNKRPAAPGQARRRRVRRAIAAGVLAAVLLTAGIVISAVVLFKIKTVTIESTGEALMYENNQILAVFGHPVGENLFGFSTREAQKNIEQALPYLEQVRIKRRLPDEIILSASPAVESYAVASESAGWAVLSAYGKVLRVAEEPPQGVVRIDGAQAKEPQPGQPVSFTEEDKLEAIQLIFDTAAKQGLGPIGQIDLSNMMEISVLYQDRIRIILGTVNDMQYKIEWAWRLVTPEQTENSLGAEERGTLDVSSRGNDGLGRARWRAGVL